MYRVVPAIIEVEAASPAEAAFFAYQHQKQQPATKALFEVIHPTGERQQMSVADSAPLERLTDRERLVAKLVMEGASNSDIASTLGITPRTVKAHLAHSFSKLGVTNRVTLAAMLLRTQRASVV